MAENYKQTRKARSGKKPSRLRPWIKRIFVFCLIIAGIGLACLAAIFFYYQAKARSYDLAELKKVPERTLVYDHKKELVGHVSGHGENRLVVSIDQVSPFYIQALLAREDARFYEHGGIDYLGILRAALRNIRVGEMDQGASTITMQLARNSFGLREKSIARKLLETAIARRIEKEYSKDEILAFYVNRVYFGSGLYGIERASQGYFMKPAKDLTLSESAILAGVIRGPSLLNPFRSEESAKDIREEVVDRLVAEQLVTADQATAAKAEPLTLRPPSQRLATGSYVLEAVDELLNAFLIEEDIKRGGLRIFTTIDNQLQKKAISALDSHLTGIESRSGFAHPRKANHQKGQNTRYLQGAVVTLDNKNGAIRALVGGRDFNDSTYNRAYRAERQIGSSFKPFVYSVATHRRGILPGVFISDDPLALRVDGGPVWRPKNSDGKFTGLQAAAIGLIRSRNTMSIRMGAFAGLDQVRDLAKALKFGDIPESPVVNLGGFDSSPMTVTSAYSTLAAKGTNHMPYLIEKIVNSEGVLLYENQQRSRNLFPESVAWVTSDVLGKVMDEGTGKRARSLGYTAPAYGKTGTTNDYRDAWFLGYTDKLTTGVWVGLDTPKKIMDRGYGSTLALPVWTEVMKEAETLGWKAQKIAPPAGTEMTAMCRECGNLASNKTLYGYQMPVPPDLRPTATCRGINNGLFGLNRNRPPIAFPGDGSDPYPAQVSSQPQQQAQAPPPRPQQRRQAPQENRGILGGLGRLIFGERR